MEAKEGLLVRNGRHGIIAQLLVLLLAALAPAVTWAVSYVSDGSGDYHNQSNWVPTGTPNGVSDSATILSGHVIETAANITVGSLVIQSNGALEVQGPWIEILTDSVTVQSGGRLQGFGTGSGIYILPLTGPLLVQNDGLISGGNSLGRIFIGGDQGHCAIGSKILSNEGEFRGGLGGSIFMEAEEIDLFNAVVETETGSTLPNATSTGSVHVVGFDVKLDGTISGLTRVVSGTNNNPLAKAGRVVIGVYKCQGNPGSLNVGATAFVDVGAPTTSTCPGLTVFSSGSSTISGTVGTSGAPNCLYWDPPDLELLDPAEISGDSLTLVGENFHADLVDTGLRATDTIEIILAPGGVLDLRDLAPGTDYFEAGTEITLCADTVLLQPGVDLEDLMTPPPQICPGSDVVRLSLTPGSDYIVNPGDSVRVPLQVANVGNAGGMVEVTLDDSAGWLAGGPVVFNTFLASGEPTSIFAVINVPSGSATHTVLSLTGRAMGQPLQEERSTFVIESLFADGFESGDTSAWSSVVP